MRFSFLGADGGPNATVGNSLVVGDLVFWTKHLLMGIQLDLMMGMHPTMTKHTSEPLKQKSIESSDAK
jgi:hypothetical protein